MMSLHRALPLTLTLSPHAGRGDVARLGRGGSRICPSPRWDGEKVPGRADEGQKPSSKIKSTEGAIHVPRS
jgi:hypothetical protein